MGKELDAGTYSVLACLTLVCRHHGVDVDPERLRHDHVLDGRSIDEPLFLRMADGLGFKAKRLKLDYDELVQADRAWPILLRLSNGNMVVAGGHRAEDDSTAVVDPLADKPGFLFVPREKLLRNWDGEVYLLKKRRRLADPDQPFSLAWFVPEFLRQKSVFVHIVLGAIVFQALGLVTPLFFQLVIDKVLVHRIESTLTVLGIGVAAAVVFETAVNHLRELLTLHAVSVIDVRLAMRTFGHMLNLPQDFFEHAQAGVLTKHMQQVDRIREFISGKLFQTGLNLFGLFVFLPFLLIYSARLSLLVFAFSLLFAVVVACMLPMFRRKLNALYEAEGVRQSLLVETIHGMRTVKSLALEPVLREKWGHSAAGAVGMRRDVGVVSLWGGSIMGLLEKMLTISLVWVGAGEVFAGRLSVGELIAVQMLAGRVSGPLVQIVSLVNEFQQIGLSVRMLGTVMNHPAEQAAKRGGLRPAVSGRVEFEAVSFTYPGMAAPALRDVNLIVEPGMFLGVVGRSGSGKTSILRLLQGLYPPDSGFIRFDGHDLRDLDLTHVRLSLGVVLQDSFFFKGTVRENIAVSKPGASFPEIVRAAKTAGAEEFIHKLPQGYDTPLEENAANLSGGQRQRLAVARALLPQPPILVFDEATSALDPESEAVIERNMGLISHARTMIVVSHRLTSLVRADAICVLDEGRIKAVGPHERLLRECPEYRSLWDQQMRQTQS